MTVPNIQNAHDPATRNIINAAINSTNAQGKAIQDLVAKGQLTSEEYSNLISVINGLISIGEVSVFDINKNLGKIDQSFLTTELLEQIAGTAPVLSDVADGSVTNKKVANRAVSPEKTDFAEYVILSNNLANMNTRTRNHTINANDGTLVANTVYDVTDFIEVKPNQLYSAAYTTSFFEYDANYNFIKASQSISLTTSNTTKFIRVRMINTSSTPFQVNEGTKKTYDEFKYSNKIKNQLLDIEVAKETLFENGVLKNDLKVSANNLDYLKRDSPNLFNPNLSEHGFRIAYNTITADANTAISGFIEVDSNASYSVTEGNFTNFYDEKYSYISGHGTGITTFITPANAKYIRITVRIIKLNVFMLVKGDTVPTESNFVPYNRYESTIEIVGNSGGDGGAKPFEGMSLGFNGDSIVQNGGHMVAGIKNALGFSDVVNYGIGGTAYAVRPAPWDTNAISLRYDEMSDNHDVICFMAGTNDYSSTDVTLGTMADRGVDTFYGALHTTFGGLVEKYPTKKIAIFTMPPRYNQHGILRGETVFDYADAIMEVAGYYSIPSFDNLRHSQLRPWNEANKAAYISDGLHPNTPEGYDLMLPAMIDFLRTI